MKKLLLAFSAIIFCSAVSLKQDTEHAKSIERGKMVYSENCITCHMGTGEGVPNAFPPLAKADYVIKTPEKAIYAIKFGLQGKIKVNGIDYDNMMPPPGLDNSEIADVMNYIQNSWGNVSDTTMLTEQQVEAIVEIK